jgi:hypothetical protein
MMQLAEDAVCEAAQITPQLLRGTQVVHSSGRGVVMVVSLASEGIRKAALRGKRRLRGITRYTEVFIDEALTPAQQRLKAAYFNHHAAALRRMREEGTPAAWRGGIPHRYVPGAEGQAGRLVALQAPPRRTPRRGP